MKAAQERVNLETNPLYSLISSIPNVFRARWNTGAGVTQSLVTGAVDAPVGTTTYLKGVLGSTPNTWFTSPLTLSSANNWDGVDVRGAPVSPGETYTFSVYCRQVGGINSGTSNSLKLNYRNAAGTRAGTTNISQTAAVYQSPGDGWVRHVVTVTVPNEPTIAFMSVSWEGYFRNNTPAGTEYHYAAGLIEKRSDVQPFFSGNSPNAVWDGAVTASTSRTKSFITRPVKTRVNIFNYVARPQLAGTGSMATGATAYQQGTTIAGTRSVSGGKQTLTATSLVGGTRRWGMLVDGRGMVLPKPMEIGDRVYFSADVDTTALAPGTLAVMYTEVQNTSGTVYAYPTITASPGATKLTGFYTVTQRTRALVTCYIWISSPTDFTGTTTAVFSNLMLTVLPPGVALPSYFDGDTPGCSWQSAANNSFSLMPVWQDPLAVRRWDGSAWALTA